MNNPVLGENIRLDDAGCDISGRDKLSGGIGGKVKVFTAGGNIGGVSEAGTVDRCSVYDVIPQNIPKLSAVA